MKRLLALALCLTSLFSCWFALGETEGGPSQEADAYFQRQFDRAGAVGGAVLVSRRGERVYSFFYGGADKRARVPVTENTVYKVASVSKLISAIGVMRLVDAGKLSLDAPLMDASGNPIRNPWHPDADVTLRQAMTHTTSLQGGAPYATPPRWERLDRDDQKYFTKREPGTKYEYANLNGGILCSEIERATGENFNAYMMKNVFSPLDINAAYAAHLLPDSSALSNTFAKDRKVYMSAAKYIAGDAQNFDDTCDPAQHYRTSVGSLYISLKGLEQLGQVLLTGQCGGVRLLSPQAVEMMRANQAALPGSSVTGESPYGLCMYRFTGEDGVTWYGHQGRWEGLVADLFVEPQSQTTVVFVMNGVDRSGFGEVDIKAARALLQAAAWMDAPVPPPEIGSFVVEVEGDGA